MSSLLPLDAFLSHESVLGGELTAHPPAPQAFADDGRGARSEEGVENEVAGVQKWVQPEISFRL